MIANNYDWTTFRKQISIDAEPEQIFRVWAVPENIVQWFIAAADYTLTQGRRRMPVYLSQKTIFKPTQCGLPQ